MSTSDDDTPSREECEKLVEQFASITGTDTALAQFFLQDRNWKLEPSINAFYEESKNEVNILTDVDDPDVLVTFESGIGNSETKYKISTEPPKKFKLLTWNIDGLDERSLKKRSKCILEVIKTEKPDIVTLQEVIAISFSYLEQKLPEYKCIASKNDGYFTATFIRITTVKFDRHIMKDFDNSQMERGLLTVEAHIGSLKLKIMNSHFESTKEFAAERTSQLKESFNVMKNTSKDVAVILCGDLNLRDKEVEEASMPSGVTDMWEVCGSRPECRYTWDLQRNTNKEFPGRFKPRCRFDRVYLRPSSKTSIKPKFFGLVGIEKVATMQMFPSDHWGIVVDYDILNQEIPTPTSSTPKPSVSKRMLNPEELMEVECHDPEGLNHTFKKRLKEIESALDIRDDSITILDDSNKSLQRSIVDLDSD